MSYWDADNNKTVSFKPEEVENYSGWLRIDCGCCAGISWGGHTPQDCEECGGSGHIYKHKKSGALALWPGGPFCGQDKEER